MRCHPFPGDLIAAIGDTELWAEPFDKNPHASRSAAAEKGSLGIVIASVRYERLVLFSRVIGWTNVNNLVQVLPC
jgi:hypothetical protein